jgi:hypothetical protein
MSFAIDYFTVLGRKDDKLQCENVKSLYEENKLCPLSEVWNDAITDIAVVTEYNVDDFDDSWTIIEQSIDGVQFIDFDIKISIAIQRRRNSKRLDHITAVSYKFFALNSFLLLNNFHNVDSTVSSR